MAFLYSLLILSTMFQDLPLKNYIGEYGASPSGFLAIAVFLFLVFYKKIYSTQFLTKFFYLVLYTVVATFVAFFIYMIIYRNGYYYGEQVLLKALKVIVYMASNYVYAISVFSIAATLKRKQVFGPFVWCLFITVFVALVEMYYFPATPPQFGIFHTIPDLVHGRIRLLTLESSTTSMLIVVYSFLTIYYYIEVNPKKIMLLLSVIAAAYLFLISSSKGLFASFLLALAICLLRAASRLRDRVLIIVIFGIFALTIGPQFLSTVESAYLYSTTFTTRFMTILIGFSASVIFPVGVSPVFYLRIAVNGRLLALQLLEWLRSRWSIVVDTRQIISALNSGSDRTMALGAGPFTYGVYWGIIGNIIFLRSLFQVYREILAKISKRGVFVMQLLLGTVTILSLSTVQWESRYDFWALIGLLNVLAYAPDTTESEGFGNGRTEKNRYLL